MLRPRRDVIDRKLVNVMKHKFQHPHDGYADSNLSRLREKLERCAEPTEKRCHLDETRSRNAFTQNFNIGRMLRLHQSDGN